MKFPGMKSKSNEHLDEKKLFDKREAIATTTIPSATTMDPKSDIDTREFDIKKIPLTSTKTDSSLPGSFQDSSVVRTNKNLLSKRESNTEEALQNPTIQVSSDEVKQIAAPLAERIKQMMLNVQSRMPETNNKDSALQQNSGKTAEKFDETMKGLSLSENENENTRSIEESNEKSGESDSNFAAHSKNLERFSNKINEMSAKASYLQKKNAGKSNANPKSEKTTSLNEQTKRNASKIEDVKKREKAYVNDYLLTKAREHVSDPNYEGTPHLSARTGLKDLQSSETEKMANQRRVSLKRNQPRLDERSYAKLSL